MLVFYWLIRDIFMKRKSLSKNIYVGIIKGKIIYGPTPDKPKTNKQTKL